MLKRISKSQRGKHDAISQKIQQPQLHQQLFGYSTVLPIIPMSKLLKAYHLHRVTRLQSNDYGELNNSSANAFIGAAGVSFLTAL